jgi:oligopeptide transport system ATP-binding protein
MSTKRQVEIKVENLTVSFRTTQGMVRAVRGVSFDLFKGETLAIVGESGSGKSVSSRAIIGILAGNAVIDKGHIWYQGQDLTKIPEEEFHKIRGNKIGMIFQDPLSALNPIMRIGKQITEGMIINGKRLKNRYKSLYHAEKMELLNAKLQIKELTQLYETNEDESTQMSKAEYQSKVKAIKATMPAMRKAINAKRIVARKQIKEEYAVEKSKTAEIISQLSNELKSAQATQDKARAKELRHKIQAEKEKLNRYVKVTKKEAYERAIQIMTEVGIPEPTKRFKMYPFQFSGGMRQRIVIAIALTADPEVLICDEPTTALDVTIQAQILDLIKKLKEQRGLSVIFITHDLGVVANVSDRVAVMYAGKIVEYGTSDEIFYNPRHPYTWALLSSMPDLNSSDRLTAIQGTPPNMLFPPKGDAFAERNPYAMEIDFKEEPPLFKINDNHYAATWLLHPDAPKVDIPELIQNRINVMETKVKEMTQHAQK